ncbi:MAG: hypothetical protein COW02_02150 [Comamonadaceae bacterium CG12_big_fil_rev_8_21_14_0_65_59_15]|nr:MAG: hypothetical protein COW02_02150 [Comamonadaceae bacterium CG12_big_fil_rev_8_21_14_0_65_59_15]
MKALLNIQKLMLTVIFLFIVLAICAMAKPGVMVAGVVLQSRRRMQSLLRSMGRFAVMSILGAFGVFAAAADATLIAQWHLEDMAGYAGVPGELKDTAGYAGGPFNGMAIGSPLPGTAVTDPARSGTCGYGVSSGPQNNGGAFSVSGLPVSVAPNARTSVVFWMYWDGTDSVMPIGWNLHDLWFVGGSFGFNTANSDVFGIASTGLAGGWHHVAAVFTNGSVTGNQLYIDGVVQTLAQRRGTPNNSTALVSSTLRIGGWQPNNGYRFSGRIDEVAVFNGTVTSAQVTAAYNQTHVCPLTPAADWRMDEVLWSGSAGEVKNTVVGGMVGQAVGGAVTAAGQICNAGGFDGISQYVSVSGIDGLLSGTASMSLWIKTVQIGNNTVWQAPGVTGVEEAGGANDVFWGWIDASGHIGVMKGNTNGAKSTSSINDGQWHHVVLTRDATSGQTKAYVDGNLQSTVNSGTGTVTQPFTSMGRIEDTGGTPVYFAGSLDEVKVFSSVLSDSEVSSIYTNEAAGKNWNGSLRVCPVPATLIGQYRFDEPSWSGAAGDIKDSSGANRHATAVGSPLPVPLSTAPALTGNPGTCSYANFSSGGSGAITVPSLPVNTLSGAKTSVSFWMYWDGSNGVMPIGWRLHDLWLVSGNFGFNTANSDVFGVSSAGLANGWHHVVAVFTNHQVSANKLYIDGTPRSLTQRMGVPNNANAVVQGTLQVSGWGNDSGYRFRGRLDEVSVFNGELNVAEVNYLFHARHACQGALPANFNCVESGADALSGHLYSKLAGVPFSFDVVALKDSNSDGVADAIETAYASDADKNVMVELVDGSGATACASRVAVSPAVSQPLIFTKTGQPSELGRKALASITVAKAYPDLRCRVTDANQSPSIVGCSSDNFAVRPGSFSVSTSANADGTGASVSAAPFVKAGANFTLNAASGVVGYSHAPKVDASKVTAHVGALQVGVVAGNFDAANALTGIATGAAFTYSEVGYFSFAGNGVYDDTFTAIDAVAGDCVPGFVDAGGKYACNFGNTATTAYFGRFVPDHFAVVSSNLTQACPAGSFTYMGQPFSLTATIDAKNVSGGKTANYRGSFANGVVTVQAENANSGTPLGSRLVYSSSWTDGAAALAVTQFTRPTSTTADATWGPYDTLAVGAAVVDPDGVQLINRNMDQSNVTCTVDTAGTSDGSCTAFTLAGSPRLRYGRLRLQNAYGSELLALPVPLEAQFWAGSFFTTNSADSCTVLPISCIVMSGYTGGLAACETQLTPTGSVTLSGGKLPAPGLRLTMPGAGNQGSTNLAVNVSATATGTTCVAATESPATAANMPWFGTNPGSRATFGIYKSPLIYRRENY